MRCEEIMKRDVRTISPDEPVQAAASIMRDTNIGFLPVCDATSGRVVGTLTDRDIAVRVVAVRVWSPVFLEVSRDIIIQ